METQYEISTKFHEIFAVATKGGGTVTQNNTT